MPTGRKRGYSRGFEWELLPGPLTLERIDGGDLGDQRASGTPNEDQGRPSHTDDLNNDGFPAQDSGDAFTDYVPPDYGFHEEPLYEGVEGWLEKALPDGSVQFVEFTNTADAVFIMPSYIHETVQGREYRLVGCDAAAFNAGANQQGSQQKLRNSSLLCPFSRVTLRAFNLRSGVTLCCSCDNPGCDRDAAAAAVFATEMQYPDQPHKDYLEVFPDIDPLCRCAKAAIRAVCGPIDMLQTVVAWEECQEHPLWQWYMQQNPFVGFAEVRLGDGTYRIACADHISGASHRWGIVRRIKRPTTAKEWNCTTCISTTGSCAHVNAIAATGDIRIPAEAHERQFRAWFDPQTQKRRLTCKSRQSIPSDMAASARGAEWQRHNNATSALFPEEGLRSPLPEQCTCGAHQWVEKEAVTAKIFLMHATQDLQIYSYQCQACGHSVELDGAEFFLLRKCTYKSRLLGKFEVCFHWSMLYFVVGMLAQGTHWFTLWVRFISQYDMIAISKEEKEKVAALRNVLPHFREATMDFTDLWGIDFSEVLRCRCAEPNAVLCADGITISCALRSLRLAGPWLPRQPDAPGELVPAVRGSSYRSRLVVQDDELRRGLRELSHTRGMLLVDFEDIKEAAAAEGLAAFLARSTNICEDMVHGEPWVRQFLHELGAESPACAIVHPDDAPLIGKWLECMRTVLQHPPPQRHDANAWTMTDKQEMDDCFPVLAAAVRKLEEIVVTGSWDNDLCDAALSIFDQILEVAQACYVQQASKTKPNFQPKHLHAKTRRVPAHDANPEKWSHEEAYYKTGVWCSAMLYLASVFGGAQCALDLFEQDSHKKPTGKCTKKKFAHGALSPGLMIIWCAACKCAVAWSLMTDSESPQTLFELLYLFFEHKPRKVLYDNGCHLLDYMLNRVPQFAKSQRIFIDHLHWKGHTTCANSFNSGEYKSQDAHEGFKNSSFAEQQNRFLASLKKGAATMHPFTLLWLVRVVLFLQAREMNSE